MASLTEQSMMHGFEDRLHDAITDVGGTIEPGTCLWKYPNIIRDQLATGTVIKQVTLEAGPGIDLQKLQDDKGYKISATGTADAPLTDDIVININGQTYTLENNKDTVQDALNCIITDVIDKLSDNINTNAANIETLKNTTGINELDIKIIRTDEDGLDTYFINGEIYNCSPATPVKPFTYFLRILNINNKEVKYEPLNEATKVTGKIYTTDEDGVIVYDIDDTKVCYESDLDFPIGTVDKKGFKFLGISVGANTKPYFIPLYEIFSGSTGHEYNGSDGKDINIIVDNDNNTISATLKDGAVTEAVLDKTIITNINNATTTANAADTKATEANTNATTAINTTKEIKETIGEPMEPADADKLFNSIFK